MDNKFDEIRGIFPLFSEENKDALIEAAKELLKAQVEADSQDEDVGHGSENRA